MEQLFRLVEAAGERHAAEMIGLGEEIWRHPETGYREVKTSRAVAERLRAAGLPVEEGLALTGVRAVLDTGRPGPTIGVVGELDALLQPGHPAAVGGCAHACGHHTHASAMYGAARILQEPEILGELCGRMVFLACPAEEGIEIGYRAGLIEAGKISCIDGKSELILEGAFDDIDLAFMNHLGCGYGTNNCNGVFVKKLVFRGKSCHASYPSGGINPLNSLELARHAIALLREEAGTMFGARIHGIISSGGQVPNTFPGEVTMEYMVRASNIADMRKLSEQFDQAVLHCGQAFGGSVEILSFLSGLPLNNNDGLAEVAREGAAFLHPEIPFRYKTGHDFGCTDMGDVSQLMPALHLNVPGCDGATLHRDAFKITTPQAAYVENAEMLALMAVSLLSDGAAKARKILDGYVPLMTRDEYRTLIREAQGVRKG